LLTGPAFLLLAAVAFLLLAVALTFFIALTGFFTFFTAIINSSVVMKKDW
jgi:hypothetical protein